MSADCGSLTPEQIEDFHRREKLPWVVEYYVGSVTAQGYWQTFSHHATLSEGLKTIHDEKMKGWGWPHRVRNQYTEVVVMTP